MKNEKDKHIFKEFLLSWLKLQIQRLENNECNDGDIEKISEIIEKDIDTKITRKEAMKHFEVEQNVFDTNIHRKLLPKFITRNIVMYPFSKLYEIFKDKK